MPILPRAAPDLIVDLWPLMAAPEHMDDNVRKYEEIGTRPAANYLAIGEALTFHQSLEFSCGIGNIQLEGVDTGALNQWLWKEHKIISVAIKHPQFEALRVTSSVYTLMEELDRYVEAILHAARYGISA